MVVRKRKALPNPKPGGFTFDYSLKLWGCLFGVKKLEKRNPIPNRKCKSSNTHAISIHSMSFKINKNRKKLISHRMTLNLRKTFSPNIYNKMPGGYY